MAKKKKAPEREVPVQEAEARPQYITDTIITNYMPYVMSVIISRAIPEIDGFKPSHRKLLYTMYKMGLLGGNRTKSANVVGSTMKLNPHGDMAIYETMVRLTRGNAALCIRLLTQREALVNSIAEIWRLPHQDILRLSLTHSVPKFFQV